MVLRAVSTSDQDGRQNMLLNGNMQFDQPNEGASVTLTTGGGFLRTADKWFGNFVTSTSSAGDPTVIQQATSSGLTGFAKSILWTASATPSTTVPAALIMRLSYRTLESTDMADLAFGTASAKAVTFSAWMKCSVASSIFGVSFLNNGGTRAYLAMASLPTADTWTKIILNIPGDVTGTWTIAPGTPGMQINVALAAGSNFVTTAGWGAVGRYTTSTQTQLTATASATFEMTGVKFERGSAATDFVADSTEVALGKLMRFYRKSFPQGTAPAQNAGVAGAVTIQNPIAAGQPSVWVPFDPPMYSNPTITTYNPSVANANWRNITAGADIGVTVDPALTKSSKGVGISTSGTIATLADNVAIHYVANTSS